jgi:hypothetical protein
MSRLSRRGRVNLRPIARLTAGTLFVAAAVTGVAGVASAAGNNGTVKLGSGGVFTNSNDPHLTCPIQIQWTGFDAGAQQYEVTFTGINPTGGTITPASDTGNFADGSVTNTRTYSLTLNGATPNNKGEYHVGIDIKTTHAANSDFKQKTVWLQGCTVNAGGTVSVTGACNAAGTGYDWDVTATPSTAGANSAVNGNWTKQGAASPTGAFSTNAAGSGSFTTGAGVNQLDLTLSTAQWALTSPTATAAACATPPSNLQLTAACSAPGSGTVTWTVTNPNADTATAVSADPSTNVSGGPAATIAGNNTTTFSTPAPSVARVAHGTVNGTNVTSNSLAFPRTCTQAQPTPASVAFTSTCAGIDGVFTSDDMHSTHFVVTAPDGSTDAFTGDATRSYPADAGAGHLDVAFDNLNDSYDWVDPGNCGPPAGLADPSVASDKDCVDGISVVLGNVNGTADVTFTVVDPKGNTHKVPVRSGQIVKESYSVTEDTTGVVTVSAPGLAKKTVTYDKDCSTVLGEKETKPPKTVVEGEHVVKTLPMTGYQTSRELQTAAGLLLLGSLLCGLASIRRRTTD